MINVQEPIILYCCESHSVLFPLKVVDVGFLFVAARLFFFFFEVTYVGIKKTGMTQK